MTTSTISDGFVTLGNLRFHYRECGDPASPPLLLLHGTTAPARTFDPLAAALADRFHIFALDQRGHGETEHSNNYIMPVWIEDVEAFVDALGLAPLSIIGHSFGGGVGYYYAARRPESVTKLVVIDMFPFPDDWTLPGEIGTPWWPSVYDSREEAVEDRLHMPGNPDKEYPASRFMPREELERVVYSDLYQRPDGRWEYRLDPVFIPPLDRSIVSEDLPEDETWKAISQVTCPTQLVIGEFGCWSWSRAIVERLLHELQRGQLVVIPQTGHSPHFENFGAFLAVVRPFLTGQAPHEEKAAPGKVGAVGGVTP